MKTYLGKSPLLTLTVVLVVLIALVNVWSAVTPSAPERLTLIRDIFSLELREFSRFTTALAGFALLLLSRSLIRLKRTAWWVTLLALVLSIITHLVKGLDYEEAIFASVIVVLLLVTRKQYVAKPDLPSLMQGLRVLLLALGFTLLYGAVGFFYLDRQFGSRFGVFASLIETFKMFLFIPQPLPETRLARWFLDSVYLIASSSFAIALIALLRPVILRSLPGQDALAKAERIVETYGKSGLARFTILGDKQFYFAGDSAFVSYKPSAGVGLALGDPIGDEDAIAKAIQGFKQHCLSHGWKPVFYQTLPDYLENYKAAGFVVLPIGQEAVVDLKSFSLQGAQGKNLRSTINKFSKAGYQTKLYPPPQTEELLITLKLISDNWLKVKHGSEKSFSLGAYSHDYIEGCPIMSVEDSTGRIVAFSNLISEYQKNELTLDLMRYDETAPNDTMFYLFIQLLLYAQQEGFDSFNLGLVALAGLAEQDDASRAEKLLNLIYQRFNQFYNFQGLYLFKSKFHPNWETRYLIYPSQGDLLPALEAIALADSSIGLWAEVRSELGRRLKRDAEPESSSLPKNEQL